MICDCPPTKPSLLDLLCRQGKHGKYFDHNFDDDVHHRDSGWDRLIHLNTLEEIPQAFKEFKKSVVARADSTGSLHSFTSEGTRLRSVFKVRTARRTSIPVKTAFAGEKGT